MYTSLNINFDFKAFIFKPIFFSINMKKTLVALAALLCSISIANAQEEGAKLAKSAGKALTSYNIDPTNNGDKLAEAKSKIDEAFKFEDAKASATACITRGDIYATILVKDETQSMLTKKMAYSGDNDALVAFEAYKMALAIPDVKKYQKGDALKGIAAVQASMINIGVAKFDKAEYDKAYDAFNAALLSHEILTADGKKSALDDKGKVANQVYITALAAGLANKNEEALKLYESIYKADKDTTKAEIYSGMYRAKLALKDTVGAEAYLKAGRKARPEDASLLFDEINTFLAKGKLDELTGSLKAAIAKEPKNVSLYVTLGNVYDNLYQRELTAKNEAKSKEYFELATKYYAEASELDPKNATAVYSTGALYYNKAALLTQELNAMPEDFSNAGMKKYNALKDQINALFDQALPFFKKAENLDPNDTNTLIALSEIFARKEELELMKEFKSRLETIRGGGKLSAPYFKG
jgi:tetratricopeptide (TPR) repeat protein